MEEEEEEEFVATLLDFMVQLSHLLCPTTRPTRLVSVSVGVFANTFRCILFFDRSPYA